MTHSRNKGARGEREIAALFNSRRTGQMQSQSSAPEADVEHDRFHLEVKRQERVEIVKWCEQAEGDAPGGKVPVVVWRRNREPWRVTLLLDDFLKEVDVERESNQCGEGCACGLGRCACEREGDCPGSE